MAGHSHSKNIAVRKGKQDANRAKRFTKVAREITAACKQGMPDPAHNPRLRTAILKARQENIPRDKIEGLINKANASTENYDEVRYEGYGPGGVAIVVEALTDNRNRTASEVRAAFTKFGGNLGESGSVAFMFDRVGVITYPLAKATEEAMFEATIEVGADNCESDGEQHTIIASPDTFGTVRAELEKKFGEPQSAKFVWQPKNGAPVSEEQAQSLLKMIDVLDDNDDVQEVFSNLDIADDVLERLSA